MDFAPTPCIFRHGNTVVVGESQYLVVVQHCVQVFNPNCIYWSIARNPSVELQRAIVVPSPHPRKDTRRPFVRYGILNAVHLLGSNCLGVHCYNTGLLPNGCQSRCEGVGNRCFSRTGIANQHETVTDNRRLQHQ